MRLELRHVTKSFGRRQALGGVDLTIPAGARVALLGPNGSGKTTLTRAILGLVQHEGEILADGKPVTVGLLAARLAYVPQVTPQLGATVDEIVRVVTGLRGVSRGVVADITADLGLELDRVRHQAVRALSGGMRQKLFLALALAAPAELLVLDEPTASLDAAARARVLARVSAIAARDVTLILCSHRLDELRALVDHVVALEDGKVTYDGPAPAYLAARQAAVIELRQRGDDSAWLAAHGFARGTGGWWTRAVSHAEKLELLPAALAELGARLDDVVVRDTDRLDAEVGHA